MNTSALRVFGVALVLLCTCCLSVRSQTSAASKHQTNTVKGRTTLKGQPVAGISIRVRLFNSNTGRAPAYRGRTDQEGKYQVTNIPDGTYQVSPEAPEFWVGDSLSTRVLILSNGETVEDVDLALVRGGVITGKVTTSGNRPLIAQRIFLRSDKGGIQPPATPDAYETDDRGVYRIFGLQSGKYRVSVRQLNSGNRHMRRFNETFYSTTAEPTKPAVVEVTEGGEAAGIDITVEMNDESQNRFSASGRIVESNGQPVPNMRLRLQRTEANVVSFLNVTVSSDTNGQFKLEDLSPGTYAVGTNPQPNTNLRTDNTNFVVVDKDVTDLVLNAVRKASVSGIVVLEASQSKATLAQFGPIFLNAYVTKEKSGAFAESARVNSDGTFYMIGLLSGIANFSLGSIYVSGPPKGLSISRVERDGIVQSTGLEIKGEEIITGVRVVLKYTNGMIRGVVKLASGELPANARVAVWLSSSQGEAVGSQRIQAVVDTRGHFFIEGVPEGTHGIEASLMIPGIKLLRPAKQQVTVSDGHVTQVTMTVELAPTP